MCLNLKTLLFGLLLLTSQLTINAQISFGSSGLVGANINNPTSLDFGPNGKLYVSQQDGTIWEYDVTRDGAAPGSGSYSITNTNEITLIKNNTPNHNDDGTNNSSQARQITGLLTSGTAANPILYVTSSDSRIGGGGAAGNDVNLDTNSGVLSRLTWNGTAWLKVDLVRGLPRCEENHSTNGMDLYTDGGITYLLMQVGGNTNQGAPSNNFAGSSEYYLSGALLKINLTQLEQMESNNGGPYFDPRTGNTAFIYDLPSLNDPERADIDNTDPNFPYDASHPMFNAIIDLGDPFGGNNGLNQTFPEAGGPVQIFSPGYRNAYDVVVTTDNRIFTSDNGPNAGWGGTPLIKDSNDVLKGTLNNSTVYDPNAGDYITGEFNIENGFDLGDALHYVGTTSDLNNNYYGGHPVPIRAFPDRARVYKYEYDGSTWVENASYDWSALISGVSGYFSPTGFTMADFPDDSRQGNYIRSASSPDVNILDIVNSSTNGICEYKATNFGGAMQGDILTASFNGNINRYEFDTDGVTLLSQDNGFLNGFGSIPLDLIARDDSQIYPGTIWVVTYGANDITIFEPADFGDCFNPGDAQYVGTEDYDNDGFTNDDEIANGTNHCSAGSRPTDNDFDFISDLTDTDDDNDGILDVQDAFAIDAQNGLSTNLPINYPFLNNDPGTGFFGLGFTGLQLDPSGTTDYLNQYDPENLSFGGAGGKATVDLVSSGDALGATNTQENAFQFGINVDTNSNPFTVHSKLETPFNGNAPLTTQSYGIFMGNGDQDNYLKVVAMDGVSSADTTYGFEVVIEDGGVSTSTTYDVANLLQTTGIDLYISVNPSTNSALIYYSLDNGININTLGSAINLPTSFLDPNDSKGLAVGIISTSGTSGSEYIATWDFMNVIEDSARILDPIVNTLDFGQSNSGGSVNELNLEVKNLGSPALGAIEITQINFTGANANLFSTNLSVPLSVGPQSNILIPIAFTPDNTAGTKTASVEIVHNGTNSPTIVSLTSEVVSEIPLVRISAGSTSDVSSTDNGPDWEATPTDFAYTGTSFSVNTGRNAPGNMQYANRDSSIPNYIDEVTFNGIFGGERYDERSGQEMDFSIPIANGNYTVNLYVGNTFNGTNDIGDRIFDILIEGVVVENNLDLISRFGHRVAGMLSHSVTVTDGQLNVSFDHQTENPLINAIEVIGLSGNANFAPNAVISANPVSGEAPLNVTFSGSNSTDDNDAIVSYDWDFGNGDTDTGINPSYTYTQDGSYTVTLTITDDGGNTNTDTIQINVLSPGACIWTDLPNSSLEKIESPSARVGDKMYVFAGFLDNLIITGATEIFDTTTDTWSTGASMPIPVTHFGIAVVGTDVWIVSGFEGNHPGVATDIVQIYDTVNDSWSTGPALPVRRGSGAIAFNNGKIHYVGGLLPDRRTDVDDHYVLDVNNQAAGWTTAAALPNARNHLSAVSFNGLIYAIGGQYNHDQESLIVDQDDLDVYDPETDTWASLADLPSARSHFEPGTLVHNGKIIIVGGRQGNSFFYDDITQYDIVNNSWSELCELPENLLAPSAKAFGSRLIVSNGGVDGIDEPLDDTRWLPIENEFPILTLNSIADQTNQVGESSTLVIAGSGGDPNGNITYNITGQPAGLSVEPTNGQIIGTIDVAAINGGPNNDGIHTVTVTATKPYSEDISIEFTWTVTNLTNFWTDKNEDESYIARHECSFVQAGDKFYLFGGRESAQTLDVYDYTTDTWNSLNNSAPVEFNHFQAVEYQGLIWVIGAFRTNNYPDEVPADFVWAFNPDTEEWIQGPEIPATRKRGAAGLVVYNDKFYVVGGNSDGHDGGFVSWLDEYDPATGTWTQLTDAPTARDHFHATVINGKLYAASGRQTSQIGSVFDGVLSEVDVYDFATQSWMTLPSAQNLPTPRAGAIVANFEDQLLIAGGEAPSSANSFAITEIYDPVSESWSVGDNLNYQRHGTQGIVSGNGIHVAGGSPVRGGGNQKNMEYYGQDNPFGNPSVESNLTGDSNVIFGIGETKVIPITNSEGNIGNILQSMTITGPDASEFTINAGDIPFKLIKPNESHDITISHTGSDFGKNAVLTVTYNTTDAVVINLSIPIYGLVYDGTSWTPNAPDDTTGSDNALIMSGQYDVTSDIEINNLRVDPGASIIVNPGKSIITNGDIDVSGTGFIELQSSFVNAVSTYSSLITDGNVSGNIIYKRHVNSNNTLQGGFGSNDLVAPPLSGESFPVFRANNSNILSNSDNSLYLFGPFNKVTGSYDIYGASENATLDPGIGYRTASTDNGTFTFRGLVNTGAISVPITHSGPLFEDWNLIGNPYPSYITLSDFLASNISILETTSAAVYGYDGEAANGWTVWNQAYSDANPNALIAPGQGFFVASNPSGGTISFSPSMRSIGQGDDFITGSSLTASNSAISHVKLRLNKGESNYFTDFYFNPNATRGLDVGYDAQVWGGSPSSFSIHSYLTEENTDLAMAIQSLSQNDFSDILIPLGINSNIGEQLTVSIAESSLPNYVNVYLEDQLNQSSTLLNASDFILTPTTTLNDSGRFFLRFNNSSLSTEDNNLNNLRIFNDYANRNIVISGLLNEASDAKLYDVRGRLVIFSKLESNVTEQTIAVNDLDSGIYVISIENNFEKITKKIIIK